MRSLRLRVDREKLSCPQEALYHEERKRLASTARSRHTEMMPASRLLSGKLPTWSMPWPRCATPAMKKKLVALENEKIQVERDKAATD